ncbi:MAG: hypothetical protein H7255_20425, partial [Ramlibacter sp.]|nr:hypothetical protein [Ramlibacter sp.]
MSPGASNPLPVRVLHESATTVVVRTGGASAVILKEYFGPKAVQRIAGESELLARLQGVTGVVQLATGSRKGVLALVDSGGESMAECLRAGRFAQDQVLSIALQTARILANVHRAGVVHGD